MNLSRQFRRPGGLVALVLLAALIAAGGYRLYAPDTQSAQTPASAGDTAVQTVAATKPRLVRAGLVQPAAQTPVNSEFFGRVGAVYVQEGQAVNAGQQLFTLEPAAGAGGPTAASPRPGPADYEDALKEYQREQKLYEQGAIPRRRLENAAARLQALREQQSSGQNAAAALQAPATIRAPLDGVVTDLAVAAGSVVQPGQQALALGSGQIFEVLLPLEQSELYLVRLGTPAAVEAAGQTITGRVAGIYPAVRENKVVSFYACIKLVDPPAGVLAAAMAVNVQLDIGQ